MVKKISGRLPEIKEYSDVHDIFVNDRYCRITRELLKGKNSDQIENDLDEIFEHIEELRKNVYASFAARYPESTKDDPNIRSQMEPLCKWLAYYRFLANFYNSNCIDYTCDTHSLQEPIYQTIGRLTKLPGVNLVVSVKYGEEYITTLSGKPTEIVKGITRNIIDYVQAQNPYENATAEEILHVFDRITYRTSLQEEMGKPLKGACGVLNYEMHLQMSNAVYTLRLPDGTARDIPQADLHRYIREEEEANWNDDPLFNACSQLELEKAALELQKLGLESREEFEAIFWAGLGEMFTSMTLCNESFDELMTQAVRDFHYQDVSHELIRQSVKELAEGYENKKRREE